MISKKTVSSFLISATHKYPTRLSHNALNKNSSWFTHKAKNPLDHLFEIELYFVSFELILLEELGSS